MATEPTKAVHPQPGHENVPHKMVPPIGGYVLKDEPIELNAGRPRIDTEGAQHRRPADPGRLALPLLRGEPLSRVRPPRRLRQRLDIPANTAVRFEPGDEKEVTLVPLGGKRFAYGFNNLVDGWTGDGPHPDYRPNLDAADGTRAEARLQDRHAARPGTGRAGQACQQVVRSRRPEGSPDDTDFSPPVRRPLRPDDRRQDPARRHRPLRRDREGFRAVYGDELQYGGGKTLRDGHGVEQPAHPRGGLPRPRHHQRHDHRRDPRRGQGRCRHPRRQDRRHRQGRQPVDHGRRHAGPRHRHRRPTPSPAST